MQFRENLLRMLADWKGKLRLRFDRPALRVWLYLFHVFCVGVKS